MNAPNPDDGQQAPHNNDRHHESAKDAEWQLALAVGMGGLAILWVTWTFLLGHFQQTGVSWFEWLQLAAFSLSGAMTILAALLLLVRPADGKRLLRVALALVLVVFFSRLVAALAMLFVWGFNSSVAWAQSGFAKPQFDLDPGVLARNILVSLLIIAVVATLSWKSKESKAREDGGSGSAKHEPADEIS